MSKGVHNIAFYVSPDPECSRTTQNSEISLAPSRGRILYAIYGNSTCVINHIVVTAIDKRYRNYYVSTIICDSCEYAKLTRKAICKEREAPLAQNFGDEIHMDLWGKSPVASLGGRRYYVTFTDDATRYTKIDIIRTKDQTIDSYRAFAAWAHTQHGATIKHLRSDRGGEYTGRAFTKLLQEEGTERRLTTHDTPK